MSDDKSKRGPADRAKISATEPYEIDYAARQLAPEYPGKSLAEIKQAVLESARVPEFHHHREMIMQSARNKLNHR